MTAAVHLSVRGLAAGYGGEADVGRRRHQEGAGADALVLDGLDLELPAGDCLAVVGRSGCGKSTLLHVLAGVLPPAAGAVFLDGAAVAAAGGRAGSSADAGAGRAAYMFQQDLLLPWKSVLGNATFAARMAARGRRPAGGGAPRAASTLDARARRLLGEFGLGDALDALPAELSGGMRQRVALARTLLMDRGLILLDEPFGSLDAVTRAEMRTWLLGVMAEHPATWVLVTHDVEEAVLLGDRVAVLQGRPACLADWTDVPLSREERRRVVARTGGRSAALPGVAPRGPDDAADHLDAAAAAISRALAAGAAA